MANAWLDSLSEDWVSQPRSDHSQSQLPVFSDPRDSSRHDISLGPVSKIPRPTQSPKRPHPSTHDALSARCPNEINAQSPQRVSSKFSDQTDSSQPSQRGRHLSRSFSASTTGSVLHSTIHHKSLSASPAKDRDSIPEWRRRLLHGQGSYGGPKNLFSSAGAGLESMFQPPPPPGETQEHIDEEGHTSHDMTMPSSPPPYARPNWQRISTGTFEDSSHDFSDIRPANQVKEFSSELRDDLSRQEDSTSERSVPAHDSTAKDQNETSFTSLAAKQRFDASRKISGKSDVRNEDFSPILLTLRSKEDGKVSFAPIELSADSLRKRLDELRQSQQPSIIVQNAQESNTPQDGRDTTQDYARQGAFLNFKRGGRSTEGSFRWRPLSPPLPTDTSEMLPESSLQASTPKQFPGTIRTTAPTDSSEHSASLSPQMLRVPCPGSQKRPQTAQSAGGSPLKLFGNYDTFTNQTLMRRISQFEDRSPEDSAQGQNVRQASAKS